MVTAMQQAAERAGDQRIATILYDIRDYHASPEDAANAASAANAGRLVLYHVVPPLPTRLIYPVFLGGAAKNFDGSIQIVEDGMLISLPVGSDRGSVDQVLR